MARKKIEPIKNLGNDIDKLTVQKSQPLFALWQSELTLAEFKILDLYLSRINSHNPESRAVLLEKGEIENCFGVKRIRTEELDNRLKHLMTTVKLEDVSSKNNRFIRIALFEEAVVEQDEHGLWKVRLECTQKAKKYFFNIDEIGYLKYKLRNVVNLKSRYTYIMFLYLEANKFRKSWEVDLDELKQILDCTEEYYKDFRRFNDKILKKVHAEMHERTECRYNYESIKKGRSVVAIRFTIQTLPKQLPDPDQMTIDQYQSKELWESALDDFHFSNEQLTEIREILFVIPDDQLPQSPADYNNLVLMRYHYMQIKATEIKRRDASKPIRSKFAYLIKIMKKDAGIEDN